MQISHGRLWQVARFCIAGSAGVAAYYAVLWSLTEYAKVWYLASSWAAFSANIGVNFALHKLWTFQNRDVGAARQQLVLYTITNIGSLAAGTALLYFMVQYMHVWYIWASVILTVVFSVVNFTISGRIFRRENR